MDVESAGYLYAMLDAQAKQIAALTLAHHEWAARVNDLESLHRDELDELYALRREHEELQRRERETGQGE